VQVVDLVLAALVEEAEEAMVLLTVLTELLIQVLEAVAAGMMALSHQVIMQVLADQA
jgi:hypothetical protein